MVGSVEPSPEVWDRIRAAAGLAGPQAPLVLPEPPSPAAPVVPEVVTGRGGIAADNSNVIRLSAQARRWRNIATAASAIAAALVVMIAVGAWQPDLLPDALRPKPRTQIVEVKAPPAPAPPSAQYVAVLQKDGGSPAFILTVDGATRNFTIRRVGAPARTRQELRTLAVSDKLQRPRSLGVIGGGDFTVAPGAVRPTTPNIVNQAHLCGDGRAGRRIADRRARPVRPCSPAS